MFSQKVFFIKGDEDISASAGGERQCPNVEALVRRIHRRRQERDGAVGRREVHPERDEAEAPEVLQLERDAAVRSTVGANLFGHVDPSWSVS